MRRFWVPWLLLPLLLLASCEGILPNRGFSQASPTVSQHPSQPSLPSLPTPFLPESPTATLSPVPSLTPAPDSGFHVRYHPDGPLFVGDQVSLEIIAPTQNDLKGRKIAVQVESPEPFEIGTATFEPFGIGGRLQATLLWVWDTSRLTPGDYRLSFTVQPDGPAWSERVRLHSREQMLFPEPGATWKTAKSECCLVNYITGTAAERDLAFLLETIDEQARDVRQRLGIDINVPITVTLMPRVLGHGGFASQEISVSYLDRNYAGGSPAIVLHHELVHTLDNRLGGDFRPTILAEGLAVYLTGGHFKPEPLMPRAAALLPASENCVPASASSGAASQPVCGLGWYLPMIPLSDRFYPSQHEIGYLQAGALVEYMVNTWGWTAFLDFYRDIHLPEQKNGATRQQEPAQSEAIELALKKHFSLSFKELETQFLRALQEIHLDPLLVEDVRLTVKYYETMRRYQQLLDPSAYFLSAWLPDAAQMRSRGIVADYLRRPARAENLALELMLISANADLVAGRFIAAERMLNSVEAALSEIAQGNLAAFAKDRTALDYLAIVHVVLKAGYQPQRVLINMDSAQVWVNFNRPELLMLHLVRHDQGWAFSQEASGAIFWKQEAKILAPTLFPAGVNIE